MTTTEIKRVKHGPQKGMWSWAVYDPADRSPTPEYRKGVVTTKKEAIAAASTLVNSLRKP